MDEATAEFGEHLVAGETSPNARGRHARGGDVAAVEVAGFTEGVVAVALENASYTLTSLLICFK